MRLELTRRVNYRKERIPRFKKKQLSKQSGNTKPKTISKTARLSEIRLGGQIENMSQFLSMPKKSKHHSSLKSFFHTLSFSDINMFEFSAKI